MSLTALYTHDDCLNHKTGDTHPESPARLQRILETLRVHFPDGEGVVHWKDAPLAEDTHILYAHDPAYLARLKTVAAEIAGGPSLRNTDEDTIMSEGSLKAALRGVGGACQAVDDVHAGLYKNAFVITRPPGHHALKDNSMGFCFFGTAALAAFHALQKADVKRVVIVDFDVHHGNGTQDLILDEPGITLFSLHQGDIWPYQGPASDTGKLGNIHNIPMEEHAAPAAYHKIFEERILPEIARIAPDFIIISAGFDAHKDDPPKGQLFNDPPGRQDLTENDFNWMTSALLGAADQLCGGRVISVLEGGYNVDVLAQCCLEHVRTLSGHHAKS